LIFWSVSKTTLVHRNLSFFVYGVVSVAVRLLVVILDGQYFPKFSQQKTILISLFQCHPIRSMHLPRPWFYSDVTVQRTTVMPYLHISPGGTASLRSVLSPTLRITVAPVGYSLLRSHRAGIHLHRVRFYRSYAQGRRYRLYGNGILGRPVYPGL